MHRTHSLYAHVAVSASPGHCPKTLAKDSALQVQSSYLPNSSPQQTTEREWRKGCRGQCNYSPGSVPCQRRESERGAIELQRAVFGKGQFPCSSYNKESNATQACRQSIGKMIEFQQGSENHLAFPQVMTGLLCRL